MTGRESDQEWEAARAAVALVQAVDAGVSDTELSAIAAHLTTFEVCFAAVYLARNVHMLLEQLHKETGRVSPAEALVAWRQQTDRQANR